MLFQQTAAPTGWTKDTTHNDKALRIVSGAAGSGGSNSFSTVMAQTTIGNHTLTAAEIPSISSGAVNGITVYPAGNGGYYVPLSSWGSAWGNDIVSGVGVSGAYTLPYCANGFLTYTNSFSANINITVASTNTGGAAHNHPITMNMQYVDTIVASKD